MSKSKFDQWTIALFKKLFTKAANEVMEAVKKESQKEHKPEEPLDPDLVKALIATESGFRLKPPTPDAGVAGKAHGLIQLTDQTINVLNNPHGELQNHLIKISIEDTSDPNLSIGAGIRWLFRKRDLASHRLKRQATWREGIAEYKAYLKDMVSGKDPNPVQMQKLDDIYKRLKK